MKLEVVVSGSIGLKLDEPPRPTRLALGYPTDVRGVTQVPISLPNDVIRTIPILAENNEGVKEPAPAGDVFTATSSDPTKLNAAIGADAGGNPTVMINALVRTASGLTLTVSDSAGLKSISDTVTIVEDVTPTQLGLDEASATDVPQPVPAP